MELSKGKSNNSIATNTNPNYSCPNCEKSFNQTPPTVYLLPFMAQGTHCSCTNNIINCPTHCQINRTLNTMNNGFDKYRCEKCFEKSVMDLSQSLANSLYQQMYSMKHLVPLNSFQHENIFRCGHEKSFMNISTSTGDLETNDSTYRNDSNTSINTVISVKSCIPTTDKNSSKSLRSSKSKNFVSTTEEKELIDSPPNILSNESNEKLSDVLPVLQQNVTNKRIESECLPDDKIKVLHDKFNVCKLSRSACSSNAVKSPNFSNTDVRNGFDEKFVTKQSNLSLSKENNVNIFDPNYGKNNLNYYQNVHMNQVRNLSADSSENEIYKRSCNIPESQLNRCVSELLNIQDEIDTESECGNDVNRFDEKLKTQQKLHNLLQPTPASEIYDYGAVDDDSDEYLDSDNEYLDRKQTGRDRGLHLRRNARQFPEVQKLETSVGTVPSAPVQNNKLCMEMMLDVLVKDSRNSSNPHLNQLLTHIQNDKNYRKQCADPKGNQKPSHPLMKNI